MIINLTQHNATPAQVAEGVADLPEGQRSDLKKLLTFNELPDQHEIGVRAKLVAEMASKASAKAAMIGGAPFFMSALENALVSRNIRPLYAFSRRESVEVKGEDGSVSKRSVFVHLGFVEA